MSIDQDRVSPFDVEAIGRASEIMDRVVLLAARVGTLATETTQQHEIYNELGGQIEDINVELADLPQDVVYRYHGLGFSATMLPSGDLTTIYTRITDGQGQFARVRIVDPSEFKHDPRDRLVDEYDEEEADGDLIEEQKQEIAAFLDQVLTTPMKIGLYLQFITNERDTDEEIAGGCVSAQHITISDYVDASQLTIDRIDIPDDDPEDLIGLEDIADKLKSESKAVRKLLTSTKFRGLPLPRQSKLLETRLNHLNAMLQLDKTYMLSLPNHVYVPHINGDQRYIQRYRIPEEVASFEVDPLYVDSLDMFDIGNGQRIKQEDDLVDRQAGLFLICELRPEIQEYLALDSSVVWVPVLPDSPHKHKKSEQGARPFKGIFFSREGNEEFWD